MCTQARQGGASREALGQTLVRLPLHLLTGECKCREGLGEGMAIGPRDTLVPEGSETGQE